jgi:hypothetical protein
METKFKDGCTRKGDVDFEIDGDDVYIENLDTQGEVSLKQAEAECLMAFLLNNYKGTLEELMDLIRRHN